MEKFNPYHDSRGRFATADGATSFTYAPGKSKAHDLAIQREKDRQAAMAHQIRARTGLEKGFGKDHAEAVEKIVRGSTEEIKAVWDKYGDEITVAETSARRGGCDPKGNIKVDLTADSLGRKGCPPYETTFHESGHSIDRAISRKIGARFSETYNNGEFEKSLISEADAYIKNHQKKMSAEQGRKVPIQEARDNLGKYTRKLGYAAAGDVSDILEGATKGKFTGVGGHGKAYWTGSNTYYWGKIPGHSVATEAFAEMFAATTTNPASLKNIQDIFPNSYGVFQKMIKEAANYA